MWYHVQAFAPGDDLRKSSEKNAQIAYLIRSPPCKLQSGLKKEGRQGRTGFRYHVEDLD